jgi:hypothetical protein
MANARTKLVCVTEPQIVHRTFVECLDAQWAAERDHSVTGFDVTHAPALIDCLTADEAMMLPICYVGVFQFVHKSVYKNRRARRRNR